MGTCFTEGVGITLYLLLRLSIFTFNTHYRKNSCVQFYHDDTVGVHYKVQVDNVISVVVQDDIFGTG